MSMRKICLVGALLGTSVVVANADTTRLRRKIKLDNHGNFRVHLNGGGNLTNLQDMVKSIMKTDEPSDVIDMFDGLVASIVGDALGAVGGRRLSLKGNLLANGAQDRSFKPLETDDVLDGDMLDLLDGDLLDGEVLDKSLKDDRLGKYLEKSLKRKERAEDKRDKRASKEPSKHLDREERKDREEKLSKHLDRKERKDREESKHLDREERKDREESKHLDREERKDREESKHLDREERKDREESKHLDREERKDREEKLSKQLDREERKAERTVRKDREFSIGEELEKGGLLNRTDRRLRGHKNESGEEKVCHEVLVSLETLQIVLQEFDTLNVFEQTGTTENRVANLLSRMKNFLREKLDALAEKRAERQAARDERVDGRRQDRTARQDAREDLAFELEIIQKIKTFLDDFSIRGDYDLLQFVDRDEPLKVLPSFDRVTKSVLDFNDGARHGFVYEKSITSDKSLGRLNLKKEKYVKLERAPKIKGHRFRKDEALPVEETETEEEPQVIEEVEHELAKEKFNKVIVSIANLKLSLLQKEHEWGVLRDEIDAEIDAVEAEVEAVERKHNLRSRRSA